MRFFGVAVWVALAVYCAGEARAQGRKLKLRDPVVICGEYATVTEKFAAQEAARAIERLVKKRPPVVPSESGGKRSRIVLLSADVTAPGAVPSQSFSVQCILKGDIAEVIVTGKGRGMLYGVRELVRNCLSAQGEDLVVKETQITESPAVPRRYLWVWLNNLKGRWSDYIDFASEWKCNGVVIWGLDAWKDDKLCKLICEYAHIRGVDVIHGFGLNGYHEGQHVCQSVPEAKGVIPEKFHGTQNGKWSLDAIYCPSNEKAQAKIQEMLLKAADAGIDGFNFETADVDYITCHCAQCEARFRSQNEDVHTNKPITWPIEHTNTAIAFLTKERPQLWLSAEYAIQKFAKAPYTESGKLDLLAKEIDRRCTVIWCESVAPPRDAAEALMKIRPESGFYVRSGAILGIEGATKYKWQDELEAMRQLIPLGPQCVMYRSGIPGGYLAVKMAIAAEAMWNPTRTDEFFQTLCQDVTAQTQPGGRYYVAEKKK